jgi:uncharacterized protein
VLEGSHGFGLPDDFILYRERHGHIAGVAYFGSQLVLAADDEAAVDAFAVETRRHRQLRGFVGPSNIVARLWERVRDWHPQPSLVRAHQPLYLIHPAALQRPIDATGEVDVRLATLADEEFVAEHSALMIRGELGYDPRVNRTGFAMGIRQSIEQQAWWVWIAAGNLRFQCNVGARTRHTAQIQGVWTPPAERHHGYATRALGAICHRLLENNATLSLYVNDFNTDAIALYERLGFVRIGEFSTLLFDT